MYIYYIISYVKTSVVAFYTRKFQI